MVQPDFPPEKPQGRTWLGLLLLLAAAGSAEVRIFNSPSDEFFFFRWENSSSLYVFFEQNMGTYYLNHLKSSS
jgi:hypothetical protein